MTENLPTMTEGDDGRLVLCLRRPIVRGSETITEFAFRGMKGKDARRLKTDPNRSLAMMLELAGYLTGQTTEVIDELEGEDLRNVIAVASFFFNGSQETGTEQ